MRDLNHLGDSRRRAQGFDLRTTVAGADSADDGAFFAVNDVRLKTTLANAVDDVVDFFGGGRAGHVDDHISLPFIANKTKRVKFSGRS